MLFIKAAMKTELSRVRCKRWCYEKS